MSQSGDNLKAKDYRKKYQKKDDSKNGAPPEDASFLNKGAQKALEKMKAIEGAEATEVQDGSFLNRGMARAVEARDAAQA